MARSSEPGRSSASRLFAVLGCFSRAHASMTLSSIAAAADLPMATAYRAAKELVAAGVLERNADGSYQIGLRLWTLGSLAPRLRDLREIARPLMERLHESTGAAVQLVVEDAGQAICIDKLSGVRSVRNITEVARGLPLHATSVGKVILAFSPPRRGRAPVLSRYTPYTITDPAVLAAELTQIRADLVGYCRQELTVGTVSVASPVFHADGSLAGALGVLAGSPAAFPRLRSATREAASSISRRLGLQSARGFR